MKLLPLVIFVFSLNYGYSQTKELYGGVNYSNFYWFNSPGVISIDAYNSGYQFGLLWGGKEENLFGKPKLFKPALALEYSKLDLAFNYITSDTILSNSLDVHSVRLSLPLRFRFANLMKKKVEFFVMGEPGVDFVLFQKFQTSNEYNRKLKSLNTFVNIGLGTTIHFGREKYENSGFKFTGISLSAAKYIPIHPFQKTANISGLLDQFRLNFGLRFTYEKGKRRLFNRDKN